MYGHSVAWPVQRFFTDLTYRNDHHPALLSPSAGLAGLARSEASPAVLVRDIPRHTVSAGSSATHTIGRYGAWSRPSIVADGLTL